jgi:hypothetical protein
MALLSNYSLSNARRAEAKYTGVQIGPDFHILVMPDQEPPSRRWSKCVPCLVIHSQLSRAANFGRATVLTVKTTARPKKRPLVRSPICRGAFPSDWSWMIPTGKSRLRTKPGSRFLKSGSQRNRSEAASIGGGFIIRRIFRTPRTCRFVLEWEAGNSGTGAFHPELNRVSPI